MSCELCGERCKGRLCSACKAMESQEDGLMQAIERGIESHGKHDEDDNQ